MPPPPPVCRRDKSPSRPALRDPRLSPPRPSHCPTKNLKGDGSRSRTAPEQSLFGLADVDIPFVSGELDLCAAAVDQTQGHLFEGDPVASAFLALILFFLLLARRELDIEIGEDLSFIGLHLQAGLDIEGQRDVDIAIHRAE